MRSREVLHLSYPVNPKDAFDHSFFQCSKHRNMFFTRR